METELKTPASFSLVEPKGDQVYNQKSRQALRNKAAASIVPRGFLKEQARLAFDEAIATIEAGSKTELCLALEARGCNKSRAHNYTHYYHPLLRNFRGTDLIFAEVGLGTDNQDVPSMMSSGYSTGSSVRGWKDYLAPLSAPVFGLDVDERVLFSEPGIVTHYIDQTDPASIHDAMTSLGFPDSGIDVFLDDGLHTFDGNFILLCGVWPYMKKNGIYMIEDIAHGFFNSLKNALARCSFDADVAAIELPSPLKSDNRIVVLQKL